MQHLIQKSFLTALVIIEVCVIAGFWIWTRDSREQLSAQSQRKLELVQQQEALQLKIREQHAYRDAITQDRSFLEHVVRDKMGYAASDEWVFIIPEAGFSASEEQR